MSQVISMLVHDASSSQYARSMLGPRRRSGSSLENSVAMAPDGHVRRRLLGSYVGRFQLGETARMPDGPSTHVSRTSAAVAPTMAIFLALPLSTWLRTHSVAARVLPKP